MYVICAIRKSMLYKSIFEKALNHGLVLKKVHRIIKFYQKAGSKSYIDMNTKSKTEAKTHFQEDFFKVMNNSVFRKNNGEQ